MHRQVMFEAQVKSSMKGKNSILAAFGVQAAKVFLKVVIPNDGANVAYWMPLIQVGKITFFGYWGQCPRFLRVKIKVPGPKLQDHGMDDSHKVLRAIDIRLVFQEVFLPYHDL
eukprot:7188891-Ditylum_brightwellii.AAC.1